MYKRYLSYGIPLLLILLFLWKIPSITSNRGFGLGVTTGAEHAADFYLMNHIKGPVFNNFDIGSFLEYRLYPSQKVFIDGRPEAFPMGFFKDTYIPIQENPDLFKEVDNRYHFNAIFFAHTDQTPWAATFLKAIVQNPSWIPVYLDHDVIILLKDTPENKELITKFGMKRETLEAQDLSTYTVHELLQLINFYLPLGLTKQLPTILQTVLQKDPNNCQVLSFVLSNQAANPTDPAYQIYATRFNTYCR